MLSKTTSCLGLLQLEQLETRRALDTFPSVTGVTGSMQQATTYDFPVVTETVAGAWADEVICGNPALELACIAAARRAVERGAVVITSDCGFFIRHQEAVAASVNVPVVMSSLLLAPTLLRQLPRTAKLAVVTADSRHCTNDLLGLDNPADRSRIAIGGIEDGDWFQNVMKHWSRDATEVSPPPYRDSDLEADVTACVTRLRAAYPEIAALLFECTGFPEVAPAIRRMTGLPTYDIGTLCRITLASIA
ncbi:hypothetical protein [Mesorhizobium sp. M0322]|uniref:hypothetical protein n=1 Tax=Mesorhizobium sp. M0322 TaxID=2956937 RepID=UPI003334B18F